MTTLIFGANGQVGRELMRALAERPIAAATRQGTLHDGQLCECVDMACAQTITDTLARIRPTCVINAAAYTAVDDAEHDCQTAFRINADAPGAIARWCAAHAVRFVHYSTDYVFDGQADRPYRSDDPTAPLGIYGKSKLAGEQAIRAAGANAMIFRTAWVYATHGRNFLRTILRLSAERDALRVVADQIGAPTPASLIADITARVLDATMDSPTCGTWHLTAAGQTSWHGFAQAIVTMARARGLIARQPQIHAITTAQYPTPAQRPAYSVLDTTALTDAFRITLPNWQDALAAVLDRLQPAPDAGTWR